MALGEAQNLGTGDYIHSLRLGRPMRARVTLVKLWKRSPERVEIHYKRGLYEYGAIDEHELDAFGRGYGS
jgi:hypothetical protein